MDDDDLRAAWAAHDAALERNTAVNLQLLRAGALRGIAPLLAWRIVEILAGVTTLVATAFVVTRHASEPRYVLAAACTAPVALLAIGSSVYLLVGGQRLAYERPVAMLQRELERMKLVEYHATKWVLLGGVVAWLPAVLLLLEAISGAPLLMRADVAWLIANAGFGLVSLAIGHVLAKRYVESDNPRARRWLDHLSGRTLRRIGARLDELAAFDR